jgi:hypothetical protein
MAEMRCPIVIRCHGATTVTCLVFAAVLAFVGSTVVSRRANLAWDDADYLRRGMTNARLSIASGPLLLIPRGIDALLHERPKPPWYIGWIQAGATVLSRRSFDALILYATIVPYALLLAGVVVTARWLAGPRAGVLALVCAMASPASLAFGGKVMVETFLSLWVLLIFALGCRLLANPSRLGGAALGAATGLALLTKLTTVLFVPILFLVLFVRATRGPQQGQTARSLAWCALVCAIVAGPWYAINGVAAIRFAEFSSKYNQVAEGTSDRIPVVERAALFAAELPGWPLVATFACGSSFVALSGMHKTRRGELPPRECDYLGRWFSRLVWASAATAAVLLLIPVYFDVRFLLPIWPALAVDLGRRSASWRSPHGTLAPRVLFGSGLAAAIANAIFMVATAAPIATYWQTATLIDGLVNDYKIATLGNVGNCAEWNVCKTGLINELRDQPENCFVLHDLTKLPAAEAEKHLGQFDAIIVLGGSQMQQSQLRRAPGLNRSYSAIADTLSHDKRFVRFEPPAWAGLPQAVVYIREQRGVTEAPLSSQTTGKRRL